VAAAAAVSLATVLHYFGSKDGLHDAVVAAMDRELLALRNELFRELVPGGDAAEIVGVMVRRAWQFARVHHVAHRIVLRTVLAEGGMPLDRIEAQMLPALNDASAVLSAVLGTDPLRARLLVQSIVQLSARYAIASDVELCAVTATDDPAVASARIADHLVDVAVSLIEAPPRHPLPTLA
jgi:AcrR family transcriptional regulator